jgi:hypothetical protein
VDSEWRLALDYIVSQWTTVDLLALGNASRLTFNLDSSDNGPFGMNTPAYFALDNLSMTPTPEPSALNLVSMTIAANKRPQPSRSG